MVELRTEVSKKDDEDCGIPTGMSAIIIAIIVLNLINVQMEAWRF